MFLALKNVMLCISYMKLASLRAKALKSIKKIVKINPETINDEEIQRIVALRLMDVSSQTREMTLDLLWHCLTKSDFKKEESQAAFEREFLKRYLSLIIERADD